MRAETLPHLDRSYLRSLSLDKALRYYLRALTGGKMTPVAEKAILARLGFDGLGPITLEAAGEIMGVTRERIRQIEARVHRQHAKVGEVEIPQLSAALRVVREASPIDSSGIPELLRGRVNTETSFSTRSLLSIADFFGYEPGFKEVEAGARTLIVATGGELSGPKIQQILAKARYLSRSGISNLRELSDRLEDAHLEIAPSLLQPLVALDQDLWLRSDGWFWNEQSDAGGRNWMVNVTRKMLAVNSPLPLSSVREGLRRRVAWRRRGVIPPLAVLREFFERSPDFSLDAGDLVSSLDPDSTAELSAIERDMVDILQSAPDGVLDRATFMEACRKRGLNLSTVGVSTTYSPVLERIAHNVWAARGTRVSPVLLGQFRDEHSRRSKATYATLWEADGRFSFSIVLSISQISSAILQLPPDATFLFGRSFSAFTVDGRATGTITGNDRTTWGWNSFFARAGAEPGDYLKATFDIAASKVALQLGGPELLDLSQNPPRES